MEKAKSCSKHFQRCSLLSTDDAKRCRHYDLPVNGNDLLLRCIVYRKEISKSEGAESPNGSAFRPNLKDNSSVSLIISCDLSGAELCSEGERIVAERIKNDSSGKTFSFLGYAVFKAEILDEFGAVALPCEPHCYHANLMPTLTVNIEDPDSVSSYTKRLVELAKRTKLFREHQIPQNGFNLSDLD